MKKRILLWIEPHPVRNHFEEFRPWGVTLSRALLQQRSEIDFRLFSNHQTISSIIGDVPEVADLCLWPSDDETEIIDGFDGYWNEQRISVWLDLTNGAGKVTEEYRRILGRLYREWRFDGILLWSENGAVKTFSEEQNVFRIHAELGSIRPPFGSAIYLDPRGTNGNAAVLSAPLDQFNTGVPAQTWCKIADADNNDANALGVIDAGLTYFKSDIHLPEQPYIFVPMQLADDLNTLSHSDFASPEDFLRKTLPPLSRAGFAFVVKGHPAAESRPINLIGDARAIAFAEEFGATILPRTASHIQSINAIKQSAAVLTINSSVGYEAMLMGKPVILAGRALYDPGSKLFVHRDDLESIDLTKFDHSQSDKIVSFFARYYLQPRKSVEDGSAIVAVVRLLHSTKPGDTDFWQRWSEDMNFGEAEFLARNIPASLNPDEISVKIGRGELPTLPISSPQVWTRGMPSVFINDEDFITVVTQPEGTLLAASSKRTRGHFFGHVDSIGGGQVTGWAAISTTMEPPAAAILVRGNRVVATNFPLSFRPDVCDHLSASRTDRYGFTFVSDELKTEIAHEFSIAFVTNDDRIDLARLKMGGPDFEPVEIPRN